MAISAFPAAAVEALRSTLCRNAALAKNSGALAVGTGATAILGFVYWWLAARSFSPETIGKASALLSLMGFVALVGEAGLGTLLTGEIVRRPTGYRNLVAAASLVAMLLSFVAGAAALGMLQVVSEKSASLTSGLPTDVLLVLGCGLTGLCYVIDQAFVGMLRGTLRLVRQVTFAAGKLIFLGIAALLTGGEAVILFTWILAQAVSIAIIELVMWRGRESLLHRPDFRGLGRLRRKAVDHYMLDVAIQAPSIIMPYLVTVLLSPASNAAFTVIWMVVSVTSVVPAALATVLFPAIRAEPDQHSDKMVLSLSVSLVFALACAFLLWFLSPVILKAFNPIYAEIAGTSLNYLGFGLLGLVLKFHICAGARLSNDMRPAAAWFFGAGLFELACTALGCYLGELQGLAMGWVVGVSIAGFVMLLMAVRLTPWIHAEPPTAATAKPSSLPQAQTRFRC